MYPEFHMQSIRSHHRNRALISCWDIQPDQMTPEAPLIEAYYLFRDLIRNLIRISFRDSFQQRAYSAFLGTVPLITYAENVGALGALRVLGVKFKFNFDRRALLSGIWIDAARESIAFEAGV